MKILISPGYGASWSTWAHENEEFMLKDPGLIALAEFGRDESTVKAYLASKGILDVYTGGWEDIKVVDLPTGTKFRITEYDGYETLEIFNPSSYRIAD